MDQSSAKRVWFYDASANPDYWTAAWNITNNDADGDKEADRRIPPIWEYGTRKANLAFGEKVSADMGKVVRYVAVNLLFTPSALYRAALTPPDMPEKINVDIALEEGPDAPVMEKVIQPEVVKTRLSVLNPFVAWSHTVRQTPLSGELGSAYECFFPLTEDTCSPNYMNATTERFFQLAQAEIRQRNQEMPGQYNVPVYLFNDTNAKTPNSGLLGRAIDDGSTGTQTMLHNFLTPGLYKAGHGFTDTVVHEAGHHLSQSHPHDGYDSERNEDYGASGSTMFVNIGDEVHSIMSYNNLSKIFGQFNLDAQYRYLTAAYLTNSNAILKIIQDSDKVADVRAAVQRADSKFAGALSSYDARSYYDAAGQAHAGYAEILNAARSAGVQVEGYKWYNKVGQLSVETKDTVRKVDHLRPVEGPVQRPEETPFQRELRLAP